jgi:polyhydroxybutyrate depolymerase
MTLKLAPPIGWPLTKVMMAAGVAMVALVASDVSAEESRRDTLTVGSLERSYEVYVPPGALDKMALVVVFHGFGGTGANALEQGGWIAKAKTEGFIVVAPDGVTPKPNAKASFFCNARSWNAGGGTTAAEAIGVDDVGFVRALIEAVSRRHPVDNRRIFATGFSNGAAMAFRVGVELSDRIAAIAPVANGLLSPARPLVRPVSLLLIWGTDDKLNPFAGGTVKRGGRSVTRPSARDSWQQWSTLLACPGVPVQQAVSPKVTLDIYAACAGGSSAELVSVAGLGHQWPGGQVYLRMIAGGGSRALNATDTIWRFFSSRKLG